MKGFRQLLAEQILQKNSMLCPGVDPHPENWPPLWDELAGRCTFTGMVEKWGESLIRASAKCPAIKFQSAFFEAEGPEGFSILKKLIGKARDAGLMTILDAKRGDISSTMAAYGKMAFDTMGADAMTVLPYMGLDSVTALIPWLHQSKGVYVVWVSSNPSGRDIQSFGQPPLAGHLLSQLDRWCEDRGTSDATGLVFGATRVNDLGDDLFTKSAKYPLLMPGLGAQGAKPEPRKIAKLTENGCTLLPLSRSLSGVGMTRRNPSWEQLREPDEYTEHVRALIESEKEELNFL